MAKPPRIKRPYTVGPGLLKRLISIRREIHSWPELAFEERRTAGLVEAELRRLGIKCRRAAGGTGVIGLVQGVKPLGPRVALRADMDGLPITEETGLSFSSKRPGFMHACGHDGHTAMLLGAAALLVKHPPEQGSIVLMFQPAEERGGGAERMIEDRAMDGVGMVFGGHLEGRLKVGTIGLRDSVDSSYTDELRFEVAGRGGHAARPHETADALLAASELVVALQRVVSRGVDPRVPVVLSIGMMEAGHAPNVIADKALVRGTLRNTDTKTRASVIRHIKRTADAIARHSGCAIKAMLLEGYPPVVNHPAALSVGQEAAAGLLGARGIKRLPMPSMGGEDFAYYARLAPGCFFRIGAAIPGRTQHPDHSSRFDFNEAALGIGPALYARSAVLGLKALNRK